MIKSSKSIQPEKHKSIDTLQNTISRLDRFAGNGFDDSQKNTIQAIGQIIQKYRECQEKELTERYKYLVDFIIDNLQAQLKPYIDNFAKTVELQDIIQRSVESDDVQDKISSDIKKKISSEILKCVKTAIRKLKKKTSGKSKNTSSNESTVIDANDQIDKIFDSLSKNVNIQKQEQSFKQQLDKIQGKHTSQIISLYRNSCKNFVDKLKTKLSERNKGDITRQKDITDNEKTKINNLYKKILNNRFKKYVIQPKKIQDGFITSINKYIKNTFSQFKTKIGKIFSPVLRKLKTLTSVVLFPFKLLYNIVVLPIIKGVAFIAKGIIKTITFIGKGFFKVLGLLKLDKVFKSIIGSFKDILSLTMKGLKKTLTAFLMTPVGMYTLGFILGYIYQKIKNGSIKNTMKEKIIDPVFNFVEAHIIQPVEHFFSFLMNDYIEPLIDMFKPLINAGKDILSAGFNFILQHPQITAFLLGLIPVLTKLITIAGPSAKAIRMAGSPTNMIMAAVVIAIAKGIPKIFAWRKDEIYRVAQGKREVYEKVNGETNKIIIDGLDSIHRKKYDELDIRMKKEADELDQIFGDLDVLKDLVENHDFSLAGRNPYETDKNITEQLKPLIDTVFNSYITGVDEDNKAYFNSGREWGDTENPTESAIYSLWKQFCIRYDKLIILRKSFNSSVDVIDLQETMDRIFTTNEDKETGEIKYDITDESKKLLNTFPGLKTNKKGLLDYLSFKDFMKGMAGAFDISDSLYENIKGYAFILKGDVAKIETRTKAMTRPVWMKEVEPHSELEDFYPGDTVPADSVIMGVAPIEVTHRIISNNSRAIYKNLLISMSQLGTQNTELVTNYIMSKEKSVYSQIINELQSANNQEVRNEKFNQYLKEATEWIQVKKEERKKEYTDEKTKVKEGLHKDTEELNNCIRWFKQKIKELEDSKKQ